MIRFRELSIRKKLILIILLVAGIALLLTFFMITILAYSQSNNVLQNGAKINARLIAEYSISPIIFDDLDGLNDILTKAETLPNAYCVAVYDEDGVMISAYIRNKEDYNPPVYEEHGFEDQKGFIHVSEEISYNGRKYGNLHLIVSTEDMKKTMIKSWLLLFSVIIILAFLAYLWANKLQRIISQPVIKLSNITKQISNDNDYSVRLKKESDDEIGELYESFNEMIEKIQTQIAETNYAHKTTMIQYERFLAILNSFNDAVYISDPKTNEILFANSTMKKLFNSSLEGKKCHEVLMNQEEPCNFCKLNDLKDIGKSIVREQFNQSIGRYLLITDKLIRWPDERIVRLQQLRDITKRKKAEKQLIKYQENLENLVEERTAELKNANEKLEKSVKEVVRMNKVFVGREFRIKELRDQINELKKQNEKN